MDMQEGYIGDVFPSVLAVSGNNNSLYVEIDPGWVSANKALLKNSVGLVLLTQAASLELNAFVEYPLNRAGADGVTVSSMQEETSSGAMTFTGNTIGDLDDFAVWNPDGLRGRFIKIMFYRSYFKDGLMGQVRIRMRTFESETGADDVFEKTYNVQSN